MKSFCRHSRYLLAAIFQPILKGNYADNLPHASFFSQRWCTPQALSIPEGQLRKQTPQPERCPQLDWTDRNKPGLKRPEMSPEAVGGSAGSVRSAAFPRSPRSPRPASHANSVGVNKREAESREQTISTTCSLPKPVARIVPGKKNNKKRNLWFLLFWSWFQQRSQWKEKQLMNAQFQ